MITWSPRRLCLALLAALVALAFLAAPASAGISTQITGILRHYGLSGGATGITVWRDGATRAVYGRHTATQLSPASNMKLLTSATALCRWGAGHRFKTELYLPAGSATPDPEGVIRGDVYIKGYGDPSLSTPSFQRTELGIEAATITSFVTELKKRGVTAIEGHVVADSSWFDGRRAVTSWTWSVRPYCGPLSALSVNEGCRDEGRVLDPARYAARVLTTQLEAAGVEVTGAPRSGVTPQDSVLAVTLLSAPLSDIVRHMDKESDNFFAEMLLKGLGRDFRGTGSTAAGLRVVRATMEALGVARDSYRIYDGSGLSYSNRISARSVVRLLRVMTGRDQFAPFFDSLSVAGVDGTLEHRMRGSVARGNFRGKTGTLSVSSCLSGYVTSAAGHRLVVSMLMNGRPLNAWAARQAQDAIAATLARSGL